MRGEILRNGGGVDLLPKKKKKRLQIASGEEGERGGILKKTVIVQVFVSFRMDSQNGPQRGGGGTAENINILAAVTGPKF